MHISLKYVHNVFRMDHMIGHKTNLLAKFVRKFKNIKIILIIFTVHNELYDTRNQQ